MPADNGSPEIKNVTPFSVLYVDDEPGLLEITKLFLEKDREFRVGTAISAAEALASPALSGYDAIVSDYQMPGMDGIAFLKEVRERFGDIPFILFTGRGREEVVIDAINNGADFYIQKGGDPAAQFAELKHKVRQAVRRKQAERSLHDSERRLADIIDFLPDATFAIDTSGKVIAWNRAIEEMTGIPAAEMLGKSDYEYAVPFYGSRRPILIDLINEQDDKISGPYTSIFRTATSLTAETDLPHPKGHRITVLAKVCYLYDRSGAITGTIESIRDITERKQLETDLERKHLELQASYEQLTAAEEELRDQYEDLERGEQQIRTREEQLVSIYNTVEDVIFQLTVEPNEQYRFISINSAFCRTTGLTRDQVIGRLVTEVIPEPSLTIVLEKYRQAIRDRVIVRWEETTHYPNGQVTGEVRIAPIFDSKNNCTHLIGSVHDITERKRAEEALRGSEERLRLFIQQAPATLAMFDTEMRYLAVSRRWMVDFHLGDQDVIGRSHYDVFPEITEHLKVIHRRCLTGEVLSSAEDRFERADGTVQWLTWEIRPWYTASNNIGGIIIFSDDVTERKQAELDLKESESFLNNVIDQSPYPIWISDNAGTLIRLNRACRDMLRITDEEVVGKYNIFRDNIVEEQGFMPLVRSVFEKGEPVTFPLVYDSGQLVGLSLSNAAKLTLDVSIFPVKNFEGRVTNAVFQHKDITDLKEAEDALRKSEEKFRRLAENAQDMIYRMSLPDGNYEYVSPASFALTGYSPEEFYADPLIITRLVHPDWRTYLQEQFTALLEGRVPPTYEFQIIDRAGTTRWINQRNVLVTDEAGKNIAIEGIVTDITERKAAEDAQRESKEKLHSFVEASGDILYSMKPDGTVTYISQKWAEVTGHDTRAILGRTFESLVAPEDLPSCREFLQEIIAGDGKRRVIEYRVRQSDGPLHWHCTNAIPVRGANGTVESIVGSIRDVTRRKNAERELRESEERYRSIVETSPDIIWETDLRGVFRYISPKVKTILGYSPEEISGRTIMDLVSEQMRESAEEAIRRLISSEDPLLPFEFPARHRDGHEIAVEIRPQKVIGPDGNMTGLRGVTRDITEQKKAQAALRESEERFRSIVETSPNIIWESDLLGTFRYLSPPITAILGYTPEEVLGKSLLDLVTDGGRALAEQALAQIASSGVMPPSIEIPARHRDGHEVILEICPALAGTEGEWSGLRGVAIDITERKRTEETLRKSRQQLADAMDIANLADWEYDVATNLFTFNDRFYALYGTSAEREGGMQMSPDTYAREFLFPEDRCLVGQEVRKALDATDPGYMAQIEHRIIRRDGVIRHILVRIRIILDKEGRVIRTYGANQDITERKEAEKSLSRANRQLALLGSVTRHDALNKIAVIMGYLNIAMMKCTDTAVLDLLKKIESNTMTVRSQMEFTKTYQDLGTQEPRWIDLETVMPRSHVPSSIALRADLQGISVYADPMLEKVFFNLLDNAIRHGERVSEIRVSTRREDGNLVIAWDDNGAGIPEREKERIFERGIGRHTGLGMFLAREILALTDITIRETGEPGSGARFEMIIPAGHYRISLPQ